MSARSILTNFQIFFDRIISIKYNFQFQYSEQISKFADQAKAIVKNLDPSNEMEYLRVKSCKQEILVASEDEYGWNQVKI